MKGTLQDCSCVLFCNRVLEHKMHISVMLSLRKETLTTFRTKPRVYIGEEVQFNFALDSEPCQNTFVSVLSLRRQQIAPPNLLFFKDMRPGVTKVVEGFCKMLLKHTDPSWGIQAALLACLPAACRTACESPSQFHKHSLLKFELLLSSKSNAMAIYLCPYILRKQYSLLGSKEWDCTWANQR